MRDTKNGKQRPNGLPSASAEKAKEKRQKRRVYLYIALFSLASSLSITTSLNPEKFAGAFLIAALLMIFFYRDMARYKPRFLFSARSLLLLGVLISGTLMVSRVADFMLLGMSKGFDIPHGSVVYAVPIASGAMLAMLLFDSHTSIMFSFVLSLLAGLWMRNADYTVYTFMGSLTAAFSVIRCKKRTEILKGGAYLIGVNMLTAVFIMLWTGNFFTERTAYAMLFAVIGAVAVTAVVSIALPVLEHLFGVTTDISLLELLNLEHPLMKTMMIAAPGTYHHSIIVGNLVESAAEEVGVNPLMARVSAYYHDIGKIKMPEYFVENQGGAANKHERLTPHMSSMILI